MKKFSFILLILFCQLSVSAQDVSGSWYGALHLGDQRLRIVLNVEQTEEGYSSTMDSPDQNVKGIPVKKTVFADKTLEIEIPQIAFVYKGELIEMDSIEGKLTQHGQTFGLNLKRKNPDEQKVNRPQEPRKPYPYISEDMHFPNQREGFSLAGTITIPHGKEKSPAVVLVSGSGLQNRDEEIFDHKPFLVLSDYLTRNGIIVLRYDDRGFGESKGDPRNATTPDFATDAESAITYLKTRKEVNPNQIGIIGHSEGGTIAFMLAAKENTDISFAVSMAGSGIKGDSLLLLQRKLVFRSLKMEESKIQKEMAQVRALYHIINENPFDDAKTLKEKIISSGIFPDTPEYNTSINSFLQPWLRFFNQYDPSDDLQKISCPVFAINGEKDIQVSSKENLSSIRQHLGKGGNSRFVVKEYPNLNHLFQTCETGAVEEYGKIEETISPQVLEDITNWIIDVIK